MTEQEAIKTIMAKACNDRCDEIHCDDGCMYGADKCAFNIAIKALEKQVPKKPIEIDEKQDGLFYLLSFMCPACNEPVIGQPYKPKYCKHCGQKLDWEGGE